MTVSVLLFASARQWVGSGRLELALRPRLGDLLADPALAALAGRTAGMRFALNEEFAPLDSPLKDGDIVAVLPPVSGG